MRGARAGISAVISAALLRCPSLRCSSARGGGDEGRFAAGEPPFPGDRTGILLGLSEDNDSRLDGRDPCGLGTIS